MSNVWDPLGMGVSRGVEHWLQRRRDAEDIRRYDIEGKRAEDLHAKQMNTLNLQMNDILAGQQRMSPGREETIGMAGTMPYTVKGKDPGIEYRMKELQLQAGENALEPDLTDTITYKGVSLSPYRADGSLKSQDELDAEWKEYTQYTFDLQKQMEGYIIDKKASGKEGKQAPVELFNEDNTLNLGALLSQLYTRYGENYKLFLQDPAKRREQAVELASINNRGDPTSIAMVFDALTAFWNEYSPEEDKPEDKTSKKYENERLREEAAKSAEETHSIYPTQKPFQKFRKKREDKKRQEMNRNLMMLGPG